MLSFEWHLVMVTSGRTYVLAQRRLQRAATGVAMLNELLDEMVHIVTLATNQHVRAGHLSLRLCTNTKCKTIRIIRHRMPQNSLLPTFDDVLMLANVRRIHFFAHAETLPENRIECIRR